MYLVLGLHAFAKHGLRPIEPGTLGVLAGAIKERRPQCHPEGASILTKMSLF